MNSANASLLILYLITRNVRTSANLKKYIKYSTDVTFTLQKSISMWYNDKSYSIEVDKFRVNKGMYCFWYILYDKI